MLLGPIDSLGLSGVRVTWLEDRASAFLELYQPQEAACVVETFGGKLDVEVAGVQHSLPLLGYWQYRQLVQNAEAAK